MRGRFPRLEGKGEAGVCRAEVEVRERGGGKVEGDDGGRMGKEASGSRGEEGECVRVCVFLFVLSVHC